MSVHKAVEAREGNQLELCRCKAGGASSRWDQWFRLKTGDRTRARSTAVSGALFVGMHYSGCSISTWVCAQQWMWVMRVRPVACRCIARGWGRLAAGEPIGGSPGYKASDWI